MVAKARGDLFDVSVGGAGFHFTSHLIALVALFIACFAIAGYVMFRNDSIPASALKDGDPDFDDINATSLTLSGDLSVSGNSYVEQANPVNHTTTAYTASHGDFIISNNIAPAAITLPAATKGSVVRWMSAVGNTTALVINSSPTLSTAPFFNVLSMVALADGAADAPATRLAVPAASERILTCTAWGIGSELTFVADGTSWMVYGTAQYTDGTPPTGAFT